MVVVMLRFVLAAAAVVSKILPRGVVTVEGTSGSGDGACAATFLPFLGGIGRRCIDVMAEMDFFVWLLKKVESLCLDVNMGDAFGAFHDAAPRLQ